MSDLILGTILIFFCERNVIRRVQGTILIVFEKNENAMPQKKVCQIVFCDTGVKYVYRLFVILFAQLASKFAKSANKHISFLQPDLSLQVVKQSLYSNSQLCLFHRSPSSINH